jgi:hypothetical protein
MRIFGRKKRGSGGKGKPLSKPLSKPLNKPLSKSSGSGVPHLEGSDVSSAGSTFETENAVHVRSERHPVPHHQHHHQGRGGGGVEVEVDAGARPRTLGELVKKLNCTESRKERVEDMDLISSEQLLLHKESSSNNNKASWRSRFQPKEEEEEQLFQEYRPVLITVQDTPVVTSLPTNQLNRARSPMRVLRSPLRQQNRKTLAEDPSTRITIGLDDPKPHSLLHQRSIMSRKRSGPKQNARYDQKQVRWPLAVKPPAPKISPADVARASKWRNGLQNRLRPQEPLPAANDDGDSTVASRSVMTGLSADTGFTGTSEYTGYTTDDTDEVTQEDRYIARNRQCKMSSGVPSRGRQAQQGDTSLLAGVAEDLGVVAGMLFMDGTACFTCVAETTQETVTSCGPGE